MNNKRSSWITYTDGKAIEHLHYLPYGETQVDQRATSYAARYTFSAKEKDEETGYSYFGARYYSSDLSVWLSVDPMADKYPSLSPYAYCANNPMILVDPDGREVILKTIYKRDSQGNKVISQYQIKITGKLFNNSGDNIDMQKAKTDIEDQIKSSFSGQTENGIPITTIADFQVVGSLKQVKATDHLIMFENGITNNEENYRGCVNDIGGLTAHIDASLFKGPLDNLFRTGAKTAAHEIGHLLGLRHETAQGVLNLMHSPCYGTMISNHQRSLIVNFLQTDQVLPYSLRMLNQNDR